MKSFHSTLFVSLLLALSSCVEPVPGSDEGGSDTDNPAAYSKRPVRKVYCKNGDFSSAELSYDKSGRLTEVRLEGGEINGNAVLKAHYGSDVRQIYFYLDGSSDIMEFLYEKGTIVKMDYDDDDEYYSFVYDKQGHLSYLNLNDYDDLDHYTWLGNDLVKLGSDYSVVPSSYYDYDYLSSLLNMASGYNTMIYFVSMVTDGAFPPVSEHLPEASNGLRFEYTLLPDGHVREMKWYMEGKNDLVFAIKLYFTDEPEADDVGYNTVAKGIGYGTVPEAVNLGLSA